MVAISAGETSLTTRVRRCVVGVGLCLLAAAPLSAQADSTGFRNVISALAGVTIVEGDMGATCGLAYERRFGRWYGLGAFADFLTSSNRNVALGISFHLHPTRAIGVQVAPGVDFRSIGADLVLLRMGVSYEFPLNRRWTISPEVDIDFEGGYRVFLIGVELGWRW